MKPIEAIMRTAPVIPVLVIEDLAHARPIAEALVAGGLKVLEVTLRTAAALDAIREMKRVDGAIVGAATAMAVRALVPIAFTYFVGWAVLKGLDTAKDAMFGDRRS